MANEVVFRRIGGRIVPIRQGSSPRSTVHKDKKAATAEIGGGLAVGAAAGAVSAKLARSHADHYNTSRNMRGDLFNRKFSVKTRLEGIRAMKAGERIKKGGAIAGAALITSGVHRLLKNTDLTEKEKSGIAGASGLGAHFAIRSAYTKVIGRTPLKFAMKHAFHRILVRGTKL